MDDGVLLERNLRGLAAVQRVIGRYAGSLVELNGAVGAVVEDAPRYPWLNALVCEPGASFRAVLDGVVATTQLDGLAVWACGPEQAAVAREAGFSRLIARVPAMSMELEHALDGEDGEALAPAEAGALSDAAYGNRAHELESALGRIPPPRVRSRGRRDGAGRLLSAAVLLDLEDDCSVQYVATRPDAQRLGHAARLLGGELEQARLRGCRTTSLQSSEAGVGLYRRLGYRKVGDLELRSR